jgi:polyhydroxybutyrate depolymerase
MKGRTELAVSMWLVLALAACSSSDSEPAPSGPRGQPLSDSKATDPATPRGVAPTSTGPAAAPSGGCAAAQGGEKRGVTIDVHGRQRSFDIVAPAKADPTRGYPLVFVFHGGGGRPEDARAVLDFPRIPGASEKAAFVYPAGSDGNWDLDNSANHNEDVAFFDAMVENLTSTYCVDRARIFATGASMGGYFANQLGCKRGDVLRAIAPHAGGGPFGADDEYDADGNLVCNGKAVAAMVFHGEDDGDVSVDEGTASVATWRARNGCGAKQSNIAPQPCVTYDGCKNPVIWCRIPGLGHDVWSQGTQATWDFFSRL